MKSIVTIYDIAREAKVSPATVSRVLTGNAGVSVEKSRRIQEIIEKHNFYPNALARSLLKKESNTIGVILPDIVNPFFASVFLEIESCALDAGYSVILCNSVNTSLQTDKDAESMYLKILVEKQVEGIIFLGGRANTVRTDKAMADEMNSILAKRPIVLINGRMRGVDCHMVRSNESEGIFRTVEYLVSLGHKNIGFIGGIPGITSTETRYKAMKKALNFFGLENNKDWVHFSGFSIESGADAIKALMLTVRKRELPTAVLAVNDFAAIGAIRYASAIGLQIPADISITGFDDTFLCNIISPALTSVNHNIHDLSRIAVNMLSSVISGKSIAKECIVKTNLVIRQSCINAKKC